MSHRGLDHVIQWALSLLVATLLCCSASEINLSDRRNQIELAFHTGSALEFLKHYGEEYRLFDTFLAQDIMPNLLSRQSPESVGGDVLATNSFLNHFKVKAHTSAKYYGVATAEAQPALAILNYTYSHNPNTDEMNLYNNKFRYGPDIDDRFMSIVLDRDPVNEATKNDLAYIYFVGVNTELTQTYNYVCKFTEHNAQSKVEIKRRLRNAINKETHNSLIRCAVPWSVSSALSNNSSHVLLDLVRLPSNPTDVALNLLSNINVPRLDALDRRTFKFAAQTMLDNLEDPMVVEWLVYNILLGIEHFYLYYNGKSGNIDLERSQLKPFLDANIVTIIYFPFLHTEHFMHIQHAALNTYLHQFGRYNEFVGFWDIDEFFMPPNERLPVNSTVLHDVVAPMIDDSSIPAMIFNTLDMDCSSHAQERATHRAVTTHCTRTGFLFEEMHHSHGKMIARPALTSYIMSPHRLNQPHVEWPDDGLKSGTFRHFNRFRYSREAMAAGRFSEQQVGSDDSLRNFTLLLLRDLAGITPE